MDASMAGYISAVPLLIFLVLWNFPKLKLRALYIKIYVYSLIILFSLLSVISLNIYREWGSKINSRAIDLFFTSTNEAVASGSSSPVLLSLLILVALSAFSIIVAKNLIQTHIIKDPVPIWQKLTASLIFMGLTFLAVRGGLDASPMNQSMVYYADKPILNHAAVNTEWNLIQDLLNVNHQGNPYKYFSDGEASSIVDKLYKPASKTNNSQIFDKTNPNIVLIILESFTADVIMSLGGEKGIAPNIEKLIKEGLFFDHIYASGDRTDKGLIAILSAFPSQATNSIIKLNDKQEKLPSISQALKKKGYYTSFYYGGQSEFFNIKSYLFSHGFESIIDKKDFNQEGLSSWGVFDDKVFSKNLSDMGSFRQPFFSTILTLSNHEPFQLPVKPKFSGSNPENKFRSTAYFTDSSLGDYIKYARKKEWFKNTIFILVADHGHRLPKNIYENYDPGRFRIPLLIFGEPLKSEFRGTIITKTGNQTDIAATILNQLKISHDDFEWSNDLLDESKPGFSFFCWDNGFGFANQEQTLSFDNVSRQIIYRKHQNKHKLDSTMLRSGKAYMQHVYQKFLKY